MTAGGRLVYRDVSSLVGPPNLTREDRGRRTGVPRGALRKRRAASKTRDCMDCLVKVSTFYAAGKFRLPIIPAPQGKRKESINGACAR